MEISRLCPTIGSSRVYKKGFDFEDKRSLPRTFDRLRDAISVLVYADTDFWILTEGRGYRMAGSRADGYSSDGLTYWKPN